MQILPQKQFKYLKAFQKKFPITDRTIFVYEDNIYSDKEIPPDIIIHEKVHIKQQAKIGADKWIKKYLNNPQFRLKQEIEAYIVQIEFFKDREAKGYCRRECAENLSSSLYGGIISREEAFRVLL